MIPTYDDSAALKQLALDAGLSNLTVIYSKKNIGIVYADEKHAKPRAWHTLQGTLYGLLSERGLGYSINQCNPRDCEFPMLVFTPTPSYEVKHG